MATTMPVGEERIGKYRVHPVASMFPLLEGEEFEDLVESIRAYGQKIPITVHEGLLLDGRNRDRAHVPTTPRAYSLILGGT
jgi:ParB-like chromosome segregation protein Spo0J